MKGIMKHLPTIFAVLVIALYQIMPHPWNFAPVTAAAIFGGMYLNVRMAVLLPLLSLILADLIQGMSWADVPFVYGSVAAAALIGTWVRKDRTAGRFMLRTAGGTLASSVLFFVVTNFGVWVQGLLYTRDLAGLALCYEMAIPFFQNTVLGDLFFVALFVGGYELLSRWTTVWREADARAGAK
jgi:hypothetical protein